jgi:hypothetical protein
MEVTLTTVATIIAVFAMSCILLSGVVGLSIMSMHPECSGHHGDLQPFQDCT